MMCRARVIKYHHAQDPIRRKLDELASTERDVRRAQESDVYTASRPGLYMPGIDGGAGGRNSSTFKSDREVTQSLYESVRPFLLGRRRGRWNSAVLGHGDLRLCV